MTLDREQFIDVLKDSYSAYYTIVEDVATELPISFRADFNSLDKRYWLTKSIPIWNNEKNEFAYVFSAPELDAGTVERCVDYAWEDGIPRVRPHKEHQCTNVKVVLVTERLDEAAKKAVKKFNRSKSYHFGLHGYSNLLVGAVTLEDQKTVTNKAGYELVSYFRKLSAAREKA